MFLSLSLASVYIVCSRLLFKVGGVVPFIFMKKDGRFVSCVCVVMYICVYAQLSKNNIAFLRVWCVARKSK